MGRKREREREGEMGEKDVREGEKGNKGGNIAKERESER